MIEIILAILVISSLVGILCYTAGYFTGKAFEHQRTMETIERYFNDHDMY